MRTVRVFWPGRITPADSAYVAEALPRPPPAGAAAAGAAPRPPAGGVPGVAAGATKGVGVTDCPLTHTSPVLRSGPSDRVAGTSPPLESNVRVNHTTPSKSGRPRDSQFPGTCMSAHSVATSWFPGIRQSGFTAPMRTEIGRPVY